jgi:hypothetical protein
MMQEAIYREIYMMSYRRTFCINYDGFREDLDYLTFILNLFSGQISFSELYDMDLDLLPELIEAKIRLKEEEEKAMKLIMENQRNKEKK